MFTPSNKQVVGKSGLIRLLQDIDPTLYTHTAYLTPATFSCPERKAELMALVPDGYSLHPSIFKNRFDTTTGMVMFWSDQHTLVALPPFPISRDLTILGYHPKPMLDLLATEPAVLVILLRLGQYAVGCFQGQSLLFSRVDTRHVKNRHRKGGQSQRRFERSRARLIQELYDATCSTIRGVISSAGHSPDHILLGGDKHTLANFIKGCPTIQKLKDRILVRRVPVVRPNRAALDATNHHIFSTTVIRSSSVHV